MYNAGERKDVRKAEKAARQAEITRIDYLRAAMATAAGRAWFCDLLERCHIFSDPFSGNALVEAYSKGERNIGLSIYADIVIHTPDDFVQMMRESNDRRIRAATEHARSQDPGRDTEGSVAADPSDSGEYWDADE